MLYNYFLNNTKNAMTKWKHYFPVYEKHFGRFVNKSVNFWEIGVFKGASVRMWKNYLGPFAKIVGIDINPICKRFEEDQINICIGDQSDTVFLQSILDKYGPPDIVLDDGSHMAGHMCASFDFLYYKISKEGVYMVEDLHCAYWDEFDGGLKRDGTFIERCKDMIDSLNARHIREEIISTHFAKSTYSMSFYDSIAVFEKIEWKEDSLKSLIIPDNSTKEVLIYRISDDREILFSDMVDFKSIVFGVGEYGSILSSFLKNYGINIEFFVDNNDSKWGSLVDGVEVISLERSLALSDGNYIVAVADKCVRKEIISQLLGSGVSESRILSVHIL